MLDLPVDLGQRLFAAHRQYRVPEGHQNAEQPEQVLHRSVLKKSEGFGAESKRRRRRQRRQMSAGMEDREEAPGKQDDDHDSRDLHDLECLFAGFFNPLQVLPPVVDRDPDGHAG